MTTDIMAFISGMPGWAEMLVVAMLGLLIFGKRLPEVGKSMGKSIVEFKKGLKGIEDDIDNAVEGRKEADMLPPPEKRNEQNTSQAKQEQTVSQANSSQS